MFTARPLALLLDLDGTLLDLDGNDFLDDYTRAVAAWMAPLVPPERFESVLLAAAVPVMVGRHPGRSNREVLWDALGRALDIAPDRLWAHFEGFLATDLSRIHPGGGPRPGARRLVAAARARGLKLAVATMPIYPRVVVAERLRRAGLADIPWDLVATDEMHTVKPDPEYFREIADRLEVAPAACLMVGDDYFQDIPARRAGMATFYVGPELSNLDVGPRGTLDQLAAWLEQGMPSAS
ncbi:MAG: HAD family hydrolase [Actinomycetia bacterium]|nr:HAD family hydrolase [Actinomycetes bacterium]